MMTWAQPLERQYAARRPEVSLMTEKYRPFDELVCIRQSSVSGTDLFAIVLPEDNTVTPSGF